MIGCALLAAGLAASPATAAPAPRNAAEFARLPALGKLIEGGAEKDYRFRTYLVGKKPSWTGAITIFVGEIHMRVQDISGGVTRAPSVRKGSYAARCSGDADTISVHIQSIALRENAQHSVQVIPGAQPDNADRTWYNVWYAVCLDELDKYRAVRKNHPARAGRRRGLWSKVEFHRPSSLLDLAKRGGKPGLAWPVAVARDRAVSARMGHLVMALALGRRHDSL